MMLAASYFFILLLKTDLKISPAPMWLDMKHLFYKQWNGMRMTKNTDRKLPDLLYLKSYYRESTLYPATNLPCSCLFILKHKACNNKWSHAVVYTVYKVCIIKYVLNLQT